tara:strand:- start:2294 stop:3823 length:1530 start_codon:yes stop_codon:yes gene_type:complete
MARKTSSDIPLKNFYGEDCPPGEYPYTSGIYSDMYQNKLWTMRQYAGFSSAKESNMRYRYLLKQGVMGLSVAFDLPTQTGYDSDHDLAEGEIGRVGVPISSLVDMEILLKDIPLDKVSISMTINSTACILLAFLIVVAEKRGINKEILKGTIQNDILKEYIARGTYIYPPKNSMNIVTDLFEYCSDSMPNWNSISISGYHIREAGATAVQELAFSLSNGISYVQSAIDKGLDVNNFGKRLSFFFNCHNHFFEEIAKFRAARRMWAKIMKERFDVIEPKAMMCRFHVQTAGSTLQAQQIDNNIIRTTLQATAAVIGGAQSLHTNSKDEALSLPTEESAQLALRTQQIIAHETGIPDVADPLSGSKYVEYLTDEIEKKAYELISKIDDIGGAVIAIEKQFQQNQIEESAYKFQQSIEKNEKVVVGMNKFITKESDFSSMQKVDIDSAKEQIKRLKKIKKTRNNKSVKIALNKLKSTVSIGNNIMPDIISAVRVHATLGEISDVLREVYGEF